MGIAELLVLGRLTTTSTSLHVSKTGAFKLKTWDKKKPKSGTKKLLSWWVMMLGHTPNHQHHSLKQQLMRDFNSQQHHT